MVKRGGVDVKTVEVKRGGVDDVKTVDDKIRSALSFNFTCCQAIYNSI